MTTQSWRKSSYSGGSGGNCVEVHDGHPDRLRVRDSKDPQGPQLAFTSDGWTAFVSAVKSGEFGDV
ncbi:DUF397 domain-containing protein [Streptomyces sp. CMB-StM0423]|uniref:DUF397 domain-containing protein n=1 Tax=Streptomyces sp. CMB-StM0423 TaxID=2059884 RepID=UPI000C71185D|nr:DUF397 domain-containing protein [Streptomyces sp. CMB-StM0423]AUH44328.1 DUF397 domain-containing protein [Streptomyces sp. CMB-StM0423]